MSFEAVFESCAGLDVHKKSVEVTVRWLRKDGRPHSQSKSFGTFTEQLVEMREWILSKGVTHVAMESTGVYWKPVLNCLESHVEIWLVNARHVKNVPGRKTDMGDSQWLAKLMQAGLLEPSFIPDRDIRNLRDLTRQRSQFVSEKTRAINRIHKVLEDANIKLSSVATDIAGKSGRLMLQALINSGDSPEKLADLAQGRLRKKIPELKLALQGFVSEHHRYMLNAHYRHLLQLEEFLEEFDARIRNHLSSNRPQIESLDKIPGINERGAEVALAEIGTDMDQFPSENHLASWVGICPGNNQTGGKNKSGRTTKGSSWLRAMLIQAAWAASRTKESFFGAKYRRLVKRRGKKRALVAVAHALLKTVYHVLKGSEYRDLGADYYDKLDPAGTTKYHVRRLENLGHNVALTPA